MDSDLIEEVLPHEYPEPGLSQSEGTLCDRVL